MTQTKQLPKLTPSQQQSLDGLVGASKHDRLMYLWTRSGCGRTTILRQLKQKLGANLIGMQEFLALQDDAHPLAIEDTFFSLIKENLAADRPLIFDDFHLLMGVASGCYSYPRTKYFEAIGRGLADLVHASGCQLILGTDRSVPRTLRGSSFATGFSGLQVADYKHLASNFRYSALDMEQIHRFAPRLNTRQLAECLLRCSSENVKSTKQFINYLAARELASNVELDEVEAISFRDLIGVDELVSSLESNIVFPLENDAATQKYGLKSKRGVLLLGPPGTGKTTIGKALAHRLRGKFFLVDGTVISGTDDFYHHISSVFEQAKNNAPAVIFIDDSDVIFESGQEHGLYRYLLTMLDGLEGESAGRVCVMLTAMDIRHIPPALIRSGRVELWLETRLPDQNVRAELLESLLQSLVELGFSIDIDEFALATDGCTPADLKRIVNDTKSRLAYDEFNGRPVREVIEYAAKSIEQLHEMKQMYAKSRDANEPAGERPVWFDVASP